MASIFCKVSLALLNRIQPILERLKENITKPWKPSIIDRSNIGIHSDSRLVILNVHDVKNQSINEQQHAILERCVNSISIFLKSSRNAIPKYEHMIALHALSTFIFTRIVQTVVLISKSAQHCLYNSRKDRCTQHMWSNDLFVLCNYNEVSSNVMWTIRNEADKTFFRTNWQRCFWYFLLKLAKLHFKFFVSHLISLNY